MNEQHLTARLRADLEAWRAQLAAHPCSDCRQKFARCLDGLESQTAAIVTHETAVLDAAIGLLVGESDHDEVLARLECSPEWPWSVGTPAPLALHWHLRSLLSVATQPPLPGDENDDLREAWLNDATKSVRAEPWPEMSATESDLCALLKHLEAHAPGPLVPPRGPDISRHLPRCFALGSLLVMAPQLAWVMWAMPDDVRMMRSALYSLQRVAAGQDHARLLEQIIPHVFKSLQVDVPSNDVCGLLAEAVRSRVHKMHSAVDVPARSRTDAQTFAVALDKQLVRTLEAIGKHGKQAAKERREDAPMRACNEERWRLWRPELEGERYIRLLAQVIWLDEVEPKMRQHVTGLPGPVVQFVASAHTRGNKALRDEQSRRDWLLDPKGHRTPFDTQLDAFADRASGIAVATLEQLQHEAEQMGSVEAIALLHFYAKRTRWHHDHRGDFTDEFNGAEGLARFAGLTSTDAPLKIFDILNGQNRLRGSYHGVEIHGLIGYVYDAPRGQKPASLRLTYLEPLRPSFSYYLSKRLENRPILSEAAQIVPLVGLPPLFGGRQAWALQAGAALRVSAFMRQRVDEAFERAGVQISDHDLQRLLMDSGYARRYVADTAAKVLTHWTKDGGANKAPAFLERIEGTADRFTFGPAHVEARIALAEAGERSARGRMLGKARAAAKVGGPKPPRRRAKRQ
jgi:hypothetical protein